MTADLRDMTGWTGRLSDRIDGLRDLDGWRRTLFLILLGGGAATGHAPVHAVPVTAISLVLLIWILDGMPAAAPRPLRRWFAAGWWFGFGYFLVGLYWIALSFLVVSPALAAVSPFAALSLAAGFALFCGLTAVLYRWPGMTGSGRVLWFAIAWVAVEWLRGTILTGFPWNLAAYLWPGITIGQAAAGIGAYGLSLLTVVILVAPAALVESAGPRCRPAGRGGVVTVAVALAMLGWLYAYGVIRLQDAGPTAFVEDVRLRLVQPSIPQHEKWKPEFRNRNLKMFLDLTRSAGADAITHVIWPETAAAMFLSEQPVVLAALGAVTPAGGVLVTGAIQRERLDTGRNRLLNGRLLNRRLFNSLHAVDPAGRIVASYDKVHLVPFGEYMPLNKYLPVGKITGGGTNFSSGPGRRVLELPGLPPASPLICYEIIFPGAAVPPPRPGQPAPRWLLNLTNDAWFGTSSGPYQHLASARMRAIEQGLPLVRSANTGVSAVVDGYGRIVASIGLSAIGVVDAGLPQPVPRPTLFARWTHWPALGLFAVVLALAFAVRGARSDASALRT